MKASIVDLRYKTKEILKALEARESVSIYYHGKLKGTIVPAEPAKKFDSKKHPLFGMRKGDKKSVKQVMEELRRPRYHDL
jgi:antitoxin (DNA-binding transcriptional repressor) of toxin-antitoxin stability system